MARPRTAVGSHGKITVTGHVTDVNGRKVKPPHGVRPTSWRARTTVRDSDGKSRDAEAWAATKAKAETRLRAALVVRQAPTKAEGLRADMAVSDAGEVWLNRIERPGGKLSPNTVSQYRASFERLVKGSAIGSLSLREVNRVPVLEGYLQSVAEAHGQGSAKTARSVVSSILTLAVRHDVLDGNRMRDVENPSVVPRKSARDAERAFTKDELSHVLAVTREHETAREFDLVDLVHFLAGTGARHSEALALRWVDVILADDAGELLAVGEVHIRGTKTARSDRFVAMPEWLTTRLRDRAERFGTKGLVFHTPGRWGTASREKERDRRNVTRHLRVVLNDAGMPWATAHTFRTTVGDLVTKGVNGTEASNILGHARASMTYDRYSDRRQRPTGAVDVLGDVAS